jgi:hypothetical protein
VLLVAFFRALAETLVAENVTRLLVDHAHFALDAGDFELADQRPAGQRLVGSTVFCVCTSVRSGVIRRLLSKSFGVDVSLQQSLLDATTRWSFGG